ncbi:MAG: Rpn family recombination-promoting nuclease/putative transposase [Symploca sp. SIO1C2]|nr:Rpn family recombination-promoting nuclease/putative transposase [Symploca sp. SIO1C2]
MFDNVCKFLAEQFSPDFTRWLLGKPITLTQLSPTELSLEPIRADSLILLQSENMVLHLEFQTKPNPDIPFRMIDYRCRVYRRFPKKSMRQVVIYLCQSDSPLVHQNTFSIPRTRHEFEVIRLWEQPTGAFLGSPGLLPFAALSKTSDRFQTLQQTAQLIDNIANQRVQSNVAASTAIIAGLVLERDLINRLLRRDIMRESVIYQEMEQEILQKVNQEVRQEFRQEVRQELRQMLLRQLTRRLGNLTPELTEGVQKLPIEQLEALGEALLDFNELEELVSWLEQYN